VYCMNHRSNVDAVVFELLHTRCPRLRVMYKAEMGKLPILGVAMRMAGLVPVARGDRDKAIEAVDLAVTRLQAGDSFLLAPEGTRGRGPTMGPFKKGAFVMAINAQVPVVPVGIVGADAAMPKGRWWIKPTTLRIRIGAPIPTTGLGFEDRDALSALVRERLEALLDQSGRNTSD